MAIKRTSAWYPDKNFKDYAYVNSLVTETDKAAQKAYDTASNLLSVAHSSISSNVILNTSYTNLNNLWKRERQAEIEFIRRYLKIEVNFSDIRNILKKINYLLQDENILQATLYQIKNLEEDEQGGYKGNDTPIHALVTYQMPSLIKKVILNYFNNEYSTDIPWDKVVSDLSKKVEETVRAEIEVVFNHTEESSKINPYEKLNEFLIKESQKDQLIKEILDAYGVSFEKIQKKVKSLAKDQVKDLKSLAYNLNHSGGSAAETISAFFMQEVAKKVSSSTVQIQTANMNMQKADLIQLFGDITFDSAKVEKIYSDMILQVRTTGERSKRLQNIAAMEELLKNMKEMKGSMVEISEKSYNLTSNAFRKTSTKYTGGFAAETPNLENLQKVLSKGQITSEQLSDLIFILVNSGDSMINGSNTKDATDLIARNIASFLFDDIVVTDMLDDYQQSLNIIHVFNLNGVMVPLSIFLEAAYQSFTNSKQELKDFVNVSFHFKRIQPNNDANIALEEEDWIKFRNAKMMSNTVAIHFFGDFINFIKQYM